jgi:hypothetical protein
MLLVYFILGKTQHNDLTIKSQTALLAELDFCVTVLQRTEEG